MTDATKPKTPPDELDMRLDYIEELIAQGMTQAHIVRHCQDYDAKLQWSVSDRQIRNYYKAALERMSQGAGTIDRRLYHVRSLKRLDYIYRKSLEKDDRRHALQAEAQIIKLLKLDEPAAEMDWKQAAQRAGIDPENILQRMLAAHAEAETVERVEAEE